MLGVARYLIKEQPDIVTGYATLHPGEWNNLWNKVQSALEKAAKKGKNSLKVDLTDVGSPTGADMQIFTYNVVGPDNKGLESLNGEIPCNSIAFKLSRKGKILKYTYDAVDDRFDCTVDLTKDVAKTKPTRPLKIEEVIQQNELGNNHPKGLVEAFSYFDRTLWPIERNGTVLQAGSQIMAA